MRVLVLIAAVTVSFCGAAYGQGPNAKAGLWESTSVTTMQMPPAMAEKMKGSGMTLGAPQTTTAKSCITQEMIDKGAEFQAPPRDNCTNEKKVTPTGLAFTVTCTQRSGGTSVAKGTVTFEGPEKAASELHLTMSTPEGAMVTTVKSTSHFVGADCGDVKPYAGIRR